MLRVLAVFAMLCCTVAAQSSPVKATFMLDDRIQVSIHEDTHWSAVLLNDGLEIVSSYTSGTQAFPGMPQNPAPTPTLTSSWVDKQGVTHSVATPLSGTSPSAIANAKQAHLTLVTTMQDLFPPRPVAP